MGWNEGTTPVGTDVADRMKGVLYGHAVGDALGIGARLLTRAEVARTYPGGLRDLAGIVLQDHTRRWRRGDWTEVTGHLLCLFDAMHAQGRVVPATLAALLADRYGIDGARAMKKVFAFPNFRNDPERAAQVLFERAANRPSDNGALLRTPVVGLWDFRQPEVVTANARAACRVTHADPVCVQACVAVSTAVAALVGGATVAEALRVADEKSEGAFADFFARRIDEPLTAWALDEADRAEDCRKTLFAAFHALKHASSFPEGLAAVVAEGGDATANGAVAGALLGARFGFAGIPAGLVAQLRQGVELEDRLLERRPPGDDVVSAVAGDDWVTEAAERDRTGFPGILMRLSSGLAAAVRWPARTAVRTIGLLTGWITRDTYHVTNDEAGDEVLTFVGDERRDSCLLQGAVGLILVISLVHIGVLYYDTWSRLLGIRVEVGPAGSVPPPGGASATVRLPGGAGRTGSAAAPAPGGGTAPTGLASPAVAGDRPDTPSPVTGSDGEPAPAGGSGGSPAGDGVPPAAAGPVGPSPAGVGTETRCPLCGAATGTIPGR
ncbi:MAG: hypothetical protein GX442_25445 [Candidatus Riflebacteria bacterium]|nr:hypothetical protein [Candidatus Riflebacteria bacterium]